MTLKEAFEKALMEISLDELCDVLNKEYYEQHGVILLENNVPVHLGKFDISIETTKDLRLEFEIGSIFISYKYSEFKLSGWTPDHEEDCIALYIGNTSFQDIVEEIINA